MSIQDDIQGLFNSEPMTDEEYEQHMNYQREHEFVIMLRQRFAAFEDGRYLNAAIDDKMQRRQAAKQVAAGIPAAPGFTPTKTAETPIDKMTHFL